MKSRRVATVAAVSLALILASLLAWTVRLRTVFEESKARHTSALHDPIVIAEAAVHFIKASGRPPECVSDCVGPLVIEDPPRDPRLASLGYVIVRTPVGIDTFHRSSFEAFVLDFPADPGLLKVRNGELVFRDRGRRAALLRFRDASRRPAWLESVNQDLWRQWMELAGTDGSSE